jgi:hypothetical protein
LVRSSVRTSQDRQFKCFLNENDMKVPPKCTNSATFFHFNGKDTSQIDYVLESTSMINEYVNFERELNTSTFANWFLLRFIALCISGVYLSFLLGLRFGLLFLGFCCCSVQLYKISCSSFTTLSMLHFVIGWFISCKVVNFAIKDLLKGS